MELTSAIARSSWTTASDRMLVGGVKLAFGQQWHAEGRDEVQHPPAEASEGSLEQALASDPVRELSARAKKADATSHGLKRIEIMDFPE